MFGECLESRSMFENWECSRLLVQLPAAESWSARCSVLVPVKTPPGGHSPTSYTRVPLVPRAPLHLGEPFNSALLWNTTPLLKLSKSDTSGRVELKTSFDACLQECVLHSVWSECLFIESMEEVYLEREEEAWKENLGGIEFQTGGDDHTPDWRTAGGNFSPMKSITGWQPKNFVPLSVVFLRFATLYLLGLQLCIC